MTVADPRAYPERPFVAVSGAIFRHGKVLLVRRARVPSHGLWTLPGGVVEAGETLEKALLREIAEETQLTIAPIGLAGYREFIERDAAGRTSRHFLILPFAARWVAGDPILNDELAEARWTVPGEVAGLRTTDGLAEIVAKAAELVRTLDT